MLTIIVIIETALLFVAGAALMAFYSSAKRWHEETLRLADILDRRGDN